jgi:hypothetical protein
MFGRREFGEKLGGFVGQAFVDLDDSGLKRRLLLVPKAGEAHDAGNVAAGGIAGEAVRDGLLQGLELVEGEVFGQPVAMPAAPRAFDDDMGLKAACLDGLERGAVEVDEGGADAGDVLVLAAGAIGGVDGDEHASASSLPNG